MFNKIRPEYRNYIDDFRYESLLEVNPLDFKTQEKCLKTLREKSKRRRPFYSNLKNLEAVTNFIYMNLTSCNDENYSEKNVVLQLEVLHQVVKRITTDSLNEIIGIENIIKIANHLISLKNLCKSSSSLVFDILQEVSNPVDEISEEEEVCLLALRKKFQKFKAELELASFCGFVFRKFFHKNHGIFIWSAHWLMRKSVEILSRDNKKRENETLKSTIVQAISELGRVIQNLLSEGILSSLTRKWQTFMEKLSKIAGEFVECCSGVYGKQVLGLILRDFMTKEELLTEETWSLVITDLQNYPRRIIRWPSVKYPSFFWLCHLLLANGGCPWSPGQILRVTSEIIFSRDRSILTPEILKSICFVFPRISEKLSGDYPDFLGNALLKYVKYFSNIPVSKMLSFDLNQLVWILYSGEEELKEATLRWWLLKSDTVLTEVKMLIKRLNLETLVLNILVANEENCESNKILSARCIDFIKELDNPRVYKEIEFYLLDSINDYELFSRLIKTRPKAPEDEQSGDILVKTGFWILLRCKDEETFRETCRFIRQILKETKLRQTLDFAETKLNLLLIELEEFIGNVKVTGELVKLTKILIQWQAKNNTFVETSVILDLIPFLRDAQRATASLYLDLFNEIALTDSFVALEANEIVLNLAIIFMKLNEYPTCCSKSNTCLLKLVKAHDWLVELSLFRHFLEQRCFFLGRSVSLSFLRLLFLWIGLMVKPKKRANIILPNKNIINSYIIRCNMVTSRQIKPYLTSLDIIYRRH